MAFDDRKTEPLIAIGCLTLVCGLSSAFQSRVLASPWSWSVMLIPVVIGMILEDLAPRQSQEMNLCRTAIAA
jgi:hypothetical protein